MTTLAEVVAARAKAREHQHDTAYEWTPENSEPPYGTGISTRFCSQDHRTVAERDADAIAACADLAAYVQGWDNVDWGVAWEPVIHVLYDAIQRRAGGGV